MGDEEIEELKRIIEEERTERRKRSALRSKEYRERRSLEVKQKTAINNQRRRVQLRNERATRPRPDACEVCSKLCDTVFDHNHKTGAFRGWLCLDCNRALGCVNDSSIILEKLAVYLRTHGGE